MAKIARFLSRFRLVYRRSNPLTKMALAVVIVLSIAALFSLKAAQTSADRQAAALAKQAAALTQENQDLQEDISLLGTPESVEKIAQEELDLVKPGTIFFRAGE